MTDEMLQPEVEASEAPEETMASESAPDTGENQEQQTQTEESGQQEAGAESEVRDPEWYTKRIGRFTAEKHENRRKIAAAEKRIQELESQLPQAQEPIIPPMPDTWDDDFDAKVKARDEAILKKAQHDAEQQAIQNQRIAQENERIRKEQEALAATAEAYTKRAGELNVSSKELNEAGQAIAMYGISNDLATFILEDAQGPLLTKYLARNPEDIEALRSLDPIRAGIYIETNIRPKASNRQNKVAPKPPETLGGSGAPKAERGPKGATYE